MNTKGNQRFIETRNKIKYVYLQLLKEKDANKITVSEICEKAEIHRTTFYGHFESAPALMDTLIKEMYEQIMSFFIESESSTKQMGQFEQLFALVKEHQDFFRQYFTSFGQHNLFQHEFPNLLNENMEGVMKEMGFQTKDELMYHQIFFSEGLSAIIRLWIERGCKESPKEMSDIIKKEYSPNKNIFQY